MNKFPNLRNHFITISNKL